MRAAQELLGVPTIGGRSARPEAGGGGSHRSQISLPSHLKHTKKAQKCPVSCPIDLKITENGVFYLKVLNKIYFREVF
jgi:hypothetical protein